MLPLTNAAHAQTCFQRTQFLCQSHYSWVKWWWTQIWCLVNVFCWLQNRSLGDLVTDSVAILRCILKHNSACRLTTLLTFGCQLVEVLGVMPRWSDSEYSILLPHIYIWMDISSVFLRSRPVLFWPSPLCAPVKICFFHLGEKVRHDKTTAFVSGWPLIKGQALLATYPPSMG